MNLGASIEEFKNINESNSIALAPDKTSIAIAGIDNS